MQNGRTVLRAFGDKLASAVFTGIMRTVNLGDDNLTGAATLAIRSYGSRTANSRPDDSPKMAGIVDRAAVHRTDVRQYLLLFTVAMMFVIDEAQRQKR